MTGPKKNAAAAPAHAVTSRPYTGPADGNREGGKRNRMTGAETAANLALDRKITDGLNLVHEQLAVNRQERLEDRREFREFRNEVRQEFKAVREEVKRESAEFRNEVRREFQAVREEARQEFQAVREEAKQEFGDVREEIRQTRNDLRAEFKADLKSEIATVTSRLDRMEGAIRELSAQVGTLLERSRGTRRLVWGVLGTLGLLVAGGVLRPVFDRALAALFGG